MNKFSAAQKLIKQIIFYGATRKGIGAAQTHNSWFVREGAYIPIRNRAGKPSVVRIRRCICLSQKILGEIKL